MSGNWLGWGLGREIEEEHMPSLKERQYGRLPHTADEEGLRSLSTTDIPDMQTPIHSSPCR